MTNHISDLQYGQHGFVAEECGCWTGLPALQTFHWPKTPRASQNKKHDDSCNFGRVSWVERYLCELVALLCCALGLAGRITQSKDDWPLVERRHVFNYLLCKGSSNCSDAFSKTRTRQVHHNNGTNTMYQCWHLKDSDPGLVKSV